MYVLGADFAVMLAGRDTGVRMAASESSTLISVATASCRISGNAWRSSELDDTTACCRRRARCHVPRGHPAAGGLDHPGRRPRRLGAAVPLGVLQARVAEFLAAIEAPLVITPWRSVLICDLDEGVADAALRVLAPLGSGVRRVLPLAEPERLHRKPRV